MDRPGSASVQLLARDGRFELPESSRPGEKAIRTRWELKWTQESDHRFKAVLPFSVGTPRGYAPPGVSVTVDGLDVKFAERGGSRWAAEERTLIVQWPTAPKQLVVEWPDLEGRIGRYSLRDSGLEPERFVRWSVTRRGDTRQGLLLPAPATATWTVDVPKERARFEAWLGLEKTPLPDDRSDGAVAIVEVAAGGQTTEAGRLTVAPGDAFTKLEADLSAWAGQTVELQLRTDPGANPDHDYVFWGSPMIWGAAPEPVRRVVVIGIDTTRPDHFGFHGYEKPTSPELDAIAATSAIFDKAWTPAPRTRPSFRSATTGRYPLDAVGAKNIAEVFREHGFSTGGFVANVHLQPRFGFHNGFDRWVYDNGATADTQVDRALAFLHEHNDRDSYVFLHILDPHIFYGAPGMWRNKFVTGSSDLPEKANRWEVYRLMASGKLSDADKKHLEELYDGEIAYTSYQLGRFFHELDKMGGRTLVIVHSDHGEEFWEHGGFEHNHSLHRETTGALFMIRPGAGFEGGRRVDVPVTLADIAPTLYDYAGFADEDLPPVDGRSLRPLVEGTADPADWDRPIGVGHLRYGHERWGVVADGHKYVLHTGSAEEELYDLQNDPWEQKNLAGTGVELGPFRNALADGHGMAVCPGFRVHLNLKPKSEPVRFELARPPIAVQILDPERVVEAPSNQAWGMPPTRTPQEVGSIEWVPGSSSFTFKPGRNPRIAQLLVFYDEVGEEDGVQAFRGESPLSFAPEGAKTVWSDRGERLHIEEKLVLSPPVGEAERMRLLSALDGGDAAGEDLAMLSELGYLGDDHGHEDPDAAQPDPSGEGPDETGASGAPPEAAGVLRAQVCRW